MVNFLPLILPMAVDYFAGGDWYAAYQRELVVAEDDITWQGMKVYPYTFQRGRAYAQGDHRPREPRDDGS